MKNIFSDFVWDNGHRKLAQAQGWDVFDNGTSVCIDRVDAANVFASTAAARQFVANMAARGSAIHMRALLVVAREIVEEQLHEASDTPTDVASDLASIQECPVSTHDNWLVSCRSQETILRAAFELPPEHPLIAAHKLWARSLHTAEVLDIPAAPTMRLVEELEHLRVEIHEGKRLDPSLMTRYASIHAEVASRVS